MGDIWKGSQGKKVSGTGKNLPRVSLFGAPDDRGISNVGGRPGAGRGPQAIRAMLEKFYLGLDGELTRIDHRWDEDVLPSGDISKTHSLVQSRVSSLLEKDVFPLLIGGGHDFGFPHFAGVQKVFGSKTALVNFDAHLDVRPVIDGVITSGSPFFMALEKGLLLPQRFVEFGIQEHCNDVSLGEYVRKKKIKIIPREKATVAAFKKCLTDLSKGGAKVVVSFDVDAVAMAFAPGVSAPQADGFTPLEFFEMARLAGECKAVASVGFFEFSPPLDIEDRTCRLVCTAIHRFLCGFSRRAKSAK